MGAKYKHALRWFQNGRNPQLKLQDVQILKNNVPEIQFIAPRNTRGAFGGTGAQIVRGSKSATYNIYGDFPEYTKIATKKIYNPGRFINQSDIDQSRKVCVIGERTQKELFEEEEEPVGKFIRIDDIYFKLLGFTNLCLEEVSKVMGIYLSPLQPLESYTILETMWIGLQLPPMTMRMWCK